MPNTTAPASSDPKFIKVRWPDWYELEPTRSRRAKWYIGLEESARITILLGPMDEAEVEKTIQFGAACIRARVKDFHKDGIAAAKNAPDASDLMVRCATPEELQEAEANPLIAALISAFDATIIGIRNASAEVDSGIPPVQDTLSRHQLALSLPPVGSRQDNKGE